MRHAAAGRRARHRGNNRRGGGGSQNARSQVFDSNGPDVRIRGTAYQIQEKYATLAKDSASAGDHVMAESYLQHAEHYQRLINSWDEQGIGYPHQNHHQHHHQQQQQGHDAAGQVAAAGREEDLALPSSILGARPQVETPAEFAEA